MWSVGVNCAGVECVGVRVCRCVDLECVGVYMWSV